MKHKILLVEDEHAISTSLTQFLEMVFGDKIEIIPAFTGIDALRMLQNSGKAPFSIALIDLMVVQLSGYELLSEIQKDASLKELYPIIISAAPNANAFGLQKNVDVVKKPIHIKELVELIEAHLKTGADISGLSP